MKAVRSARVAYPEGERGGRNAASGLLRVEEAAAKESGHIRPAGLALVKVKEVVAKKERPQKAD